MKDTLLLDIAPASERALVDAARDDAPIQGLTHNHYRYPARFSPSFARQVIATFSRPGDLVLDPHVGGGTTVVEAAAAGRDAIGVDLNSLAEFVSKVKTSLYGDDDLMILSAWAEVACRHTRNVEDHTPARSRADGASFDVASYPRHLDHPDRRSLASAIARLMATTAELPTRLRDFARCVILRTAQIALDGRRVPMAVARFIEALGEQALLMIAAARAFAAAVAAQARRPHVEILLRSSAGLEGEPRARWLGPPRLVLTSPPYPGVHVLYNRWQVGGGKETAAPLWIAEREDRTAASHYTMGDRRTHGRDAYFAAMREVMRSVALLIDGDTVVVQMLAFGDVASQLPRYIATMEEAGLSEARLPGIAGVGDGRLWRTVPNRRWYSTLRGDTPGSHEVVLFHVASPATVHAPAPAAGDLASTIAAPELAMV